MTSGRLTPGWGDARRAGIRQRIPVTSDLSSTAALARATDPTTSAAELAVLAERHPETRALVAEHPAAYAGLLEWLGLLGDPAVDAALARRRGVPAPAAEPVPPAEPAVAPALAVQAQPAAVWREPNRSTPLRWGPYQVRYLLGLALLFAGAISLVVSFWPTFRSFGDVVDPITALVGYALSILGWAVLPAPGLRRLRAALIGIVALWVAANTITTSVFVGLDATIRNAGLAGTLFGTWLLAPPATALASTAVLAAWLMVRQRPGITFVLLIPTFIVGCALSFWSVATMGFGAAAPLNVLVWPLAPLLSPSALVIVVPSVIGWLLLIVAPAWIARGWAVSRDRARIRASAVAATPAVAPAPGAAERTNAFAIVALCTAFVASVLGIVFGHVALSQIARTGEGGRGLAIAGLVIGYAGVAVAVILVITQLAFLGALGLFR